MMNILLNAGRSQHIDTRVNLANTSTAIPSTTIVVTSCQTSHWIATGTDPVINTATSFIVPANTITRFSINPNDKVAVAAHGSTGHIGIAY
jgi:hypothetical protein